MEKTGRNSHRYSFFNDRRDFLHDWCQFTLRRWRDYAIVGNF
ncbi:MAG: hypothetical protein ACTSUT_04045 [Promethearchaeota archaeon]